MRMLIASLGMAFLVGACQSSPSQPATRAQPTATQPGVAPKTQTVVVRHVVATPATSVTHPSPKAPSAQVAAVGQVAPDFTLPAYHRGKFTQVKLSSFRGKWVLLCFYPGDFTFVWATEVSAVADRYSELTALGAEVLSISTNSKFVHKMWNDKELSKMVKGGVPFPMLSDGGGNVGRLYGVYRPSQGVNIRGRFLIDPDGVIQGIEILAPPVGRNLDESIRQLKAFGHVRKTKGREVCPAGWQPGATVLKPGPDLVGKVWKVWKPKKKSN